MEELALIIFTICVQAAVGLMVFTAVAKQLNKDGIFKTAVALAAGLAIVGLLASFLHLGHCRCQYAHGVRHFLAKPRDLVYQRLYRPDSARRLAHLL
nr:DmsC/YnfH family molybdoenzyme membrane anchor subunit [Desulfitobacterium hafniense]